MNTNDVLKRLRYAIDIKDSDMLDLFAATGVAVDAGRLAACFLKDDDPAYQTCPRWVLEALLDGLIIRFRGPRLVDGDSPPQTRQALTKADGAPGLDNNMILKKIRIALALQEAAVLAIMELGGMPVSRHEVGALFRQRGQKNYRECGDQFMRAFLVGLARYRMAGKLHPAGSGPTDSAARS
jgi:uncharacterized protein YehS (DUF1456 family)